MPSAAGVVRVNQTILSVNSGTAIVAAPLTAYGIIGVNDSGARMQEARDFKSWTFSLFGGGTGYGITLYGTTDPAAYKAWMYSFNPMSPFGNVTIPATSWFQLFAPSEQTGAGTAPANPMTSGNPAMQYNGVLLAVRAVLTASTAPAGVVSVSVDAVP